MTDFTQMEDQNIYKNEVHTKEKRINYAFQLLKDGFPASVVAELTGLMESELSKPDVRN